MPNALNPFAEDLIGGSGSDGAGTAPPPQPSPFAGTEHPFQFNALKHPVSCSTRPVHCIDCMLLSDKRFYWRYWKLRKCRENMYLYVFGIGIADSYFQGNWLQYVYFFLIFKLKSFGLALPAPLGCSETTLTCQGCWTHHFYRQLLFRQRTDSILSRFSTESIQWVGTIAPSKVSE